MPSAKLIGASLVVLLFGCACGVTFAAPVVPVALSDQQAVGAPVGQNFGNLLSGKIELNDLGQVAFIAQTTIGPSGGRTFGIWAGQPGSLASVVRAGMAAPGAAPGATFSDFRSGFDFNNNGHLAIIGTVSGVSGGGSGIWSNTSGNWELIAQKGDAVTVGTLSTNLSDFSHISLDDTGRTLFASAVTGSPRHQAIWRSDANSFDLIASTRTQAPGTPAGNAFLWRNAFYISTNRPGNLALAALLTDQPDGPPNRAVGSGIWSDRSGSLELIVRGGDPFSLGLPGEIYSTQIVTSLDPPAFNDLGDIAQRAVLMGPSVTSMNDSALVLHRPSGVELIVREGAAAPGTTAGTMFTEFHSLSLNNSGQIAFFGTLNSISTDNLGLWTGDTDNFELLVREGAKAPGTPDDVTFFDLHAHLLPALNDSGKLAFTARLQGLGVNASNDVGIWGASPNGFLQLIAREGDSIEVAPNDFRVISALNQLDVISERIMPLEMNSHGQIVFHARFTDGSMGVFLSNALAIPEPASSTLIVWLALFALSRSRRAARS
jgi:hypothetical protein